MHLAMAPTSRVLPLLCLILVSECFLLDKHYANRYAVLRRTQCFDWSLAYLDSKASKVPL